MNKKLLEEWFDDIESIIFDIDISIKNIERMLKSEDQNEKDVLRHGFFQHYIRQTRLSIIVHLCKLLGDSTSQKRSLKKLFNALENQNYDECLLKHFESANESQTLFKSKDEVIVAINSLQNEIKEKGLIIEKLIILRDKFYAHKDPDASLPNLSYAELKELIQFVKYTYNKLNNGFFNRTFMFDIGSSWSIDYALRVLAKDNKRRKK